MGVCAGSYKPDKTDWYRIDLRVASGARWRGGCRGDAQCGIFWKTERESTWHKFVGIDGQFKTGTLPSHVRFEKPYVEVVASQTRDEDSSVMDVTYVVWSPADKVNVRALAFEDGVRSFANVIRPTTFLDGSVIGDNVPANTTNTFSWKVSADWKSERAEATATYAAPALEIVAFDPKTRRVRIRVTPGEGNAIRAPLPSCPCPVIRLPPFPCWLHSSCPIILSEGHPKNLPSLGGD